MQERTQDFKLESLELRKKKTSNMHPYIINKLSTNTNTQNNCFLIY